jgi:hypothetical protein
MLKMEYEFGASKWEREQVSATQTFWKILSSKLFFVGV